MHPTKPIASLAAALALALCACWDAPSGPEERTVYVIQAGGGEQFRILLEDPALVAEAERHLRSGRVGVISGTLAAGDGGFNMPYRWHLVPASVHFPDVAIELCDGRPSFVENELDYWLGRVGAYCPWGARVLRRVSSSP
jgi:hypothetical protein